MRAPPPPDGEVVRAVLDGRVEAYAFLVHRYKDFLFRYAERMTGGPDAAADVVQSAFVKGYRDLARCRTPERVKAWLFRIVVNGCKDHLKSRATRNVPLDDLPALASPRGDPQEFLERSELRAEIEDALACLPVEQREAFVLKHLEGRSYMEMSELLEVSVPALKMRVHRAREQMQTSLNRYR